MADRCRSRPAQPAFVVIAPEDDSGAEPSRANPITRLQILIGGYLARHPSLLTVLEWLGWNNPGGSINP